MKADGVTLESIGGRARRPLDRKRAQSVIDELSAVADRLANGDGDGK